MAATRDREDGLQRSLVRLRKRERDRQRQMAELREQLRAAQVQASASGIGLSANRERIVQLERHVVRLQRALAHSERRVTVSESQQLKLLRAMRLLAEEFDRAGLVRPQAVAAARALAPPVESKADPYAEEEDEEDGEEEDAGRRALRLRSAFEGAKLQVPRSLGSSVLEEAAVADAQFEQFRQPQQQQGQQQQHKQQQPRSGPLPPLRVKTPQQKPQLRRTGSRTQLALSVAAPARGARSPTASANGGRRWTKDGGGGMVVPLSVTPSPIHGVSSGGASPNPGGMSPATLSPPDALLSSRGRDEADERALMTATGMGSISSMQSGVRHERYTDASSFRDALLVLAMENTEWRRTVRVLQGRVEQLEEQLRRCNRQEEEGEEEEVGEEGGGEEEEG